jgi:hypothetical protein
MQPDPFQDPRGGGGIWPAKPELLGRLVAFVVKGYNPDAKMQDGTPAPEIECDLFVLDGGPLEFGGKYPITGDHTPPHLVIQTPCVFVGARYSGVNFVNALKDKIGGGPVIGVVERSTFGRKPYNITKEQTGPGSPKRQLAGQFWSSMMLGEWTPPEATPIPGRGAPIPGANPYAQPQVQPAPVAPPAAVPAVDPAYAAYLAAQQAPAAAPPVDPAYAAWLATQGQPAAPAPVAIPAGYEPIWHTLTDAQRATVLAGPAGQQQQATPGRPNPY